MVQAVGENMRGMVDAMLGGDEVGVSESLRAVLATQMVGASGEQVDQTLEQQVKVFTSPWMMRFVEIDPAEYLSRVTQPTLALFGSVDLQVVPSINAPRMRDALRVCDPPFSVDSSIGVDPPKVNTEQVARLNSHALQFGRRWSRSDTHAAAAPAGTYSVH